MYLLLGVCYIDSMETRKVQATGGSSLTLTLPKGWVRDHGLKGKEAVSVSVAGDSLVVTPETARRKAKSHTTIEIEQHSKESLLRTTVATYISGANSIIYTASALSTEQARYIKQICTRFLFGFEVTDESGAHITITNIFDASKNQPNVSTKNIASMAMSMYTDALAALHENNRQMAQDIIVRDDEVDKMLIVIKRQFQQLISGQVVGDTITSSMYRSVAIQLERIADHAVRIAEVVRMSESDIVLSDHFTAMRDTAQALLAACRDLITQPDGAAAMELLEQVSRNEEVMRQSKRLKQSYEGAIIEDSLDRLCSCIKNIAEHIIEYHYVNISLHEL